MTLDERRKIGALEMICGPMFCGKTEELIRRLRRSVIAKQNVQVFKPRIDTRYDAVRVASHAGSTFDAVPVDNALDLWKQVQPATNVVGIDEIQFLDERILTVVGWLTMRGVRVIGAGLDRDFRGEPFGQIPTLLARADRVDKLTAICTVCGGDATCTQRLIDGRPASSRSPVILVAGSDQYEARCRDHHQLRA